MDERKKTIAVLATNIASAIIESLGKTGAAIAEIDSGPIIKQSILIATRIYDEVANMKN